MPVRTTNPLSPLVTVAVTPAIEAAGVGSDAAVGAVVLDDDDELEPVPEEVELVPVPVPVPLPEEDDDEEEELPELPEETVPPTIVLIDWTVPLEGDLSTVPSRVRCAESSWTCAEVTEFWAWLSWLAVGGASVTAC